MSEKQKTASLDYNDPRRNVDGRQPKWWLYHPSTIRRLQERYSLRLVWAVAVGVMIGTLIAVKM